MKYALIALALTFGNAAFAGGTVQPLFQMANDRDANVDSYGILADAGSAQAIVLAPNGQGDRGQTFPFSQIASPNGAVILSGQGHNVLYFQGQLDRSTQTGRFHAKYLSNGLTNQYTTCDFLLQKDANGWYVQNAYTGARVTQVKIVTWTLGLKTLQGICQ